MSARHHVVLVPGFFGFVNLGRLVYFSHVREFVEAAFDRRGLEVVVHRVHVSPTASLVRRASTLRDFLTGNVPVAGRDPIHIVGHSTGGLDARLFLSPGVVLEQDPEGASGPPVDAVARRVSSLVSVATPHRGTPLAGLFTSMLGQQLLRLLSVATVGALRSGRVPISVLARSGAAMARTGGKTHALLDQLADELIRALPEEERLPISAFFHDVGSDQALLAQLGPEATTVFNATAGDRPGVRYGCVLTRAPRHTLRHRLGLGPYDQATYTIFQILRDRTASGWGRVAGADDWLAALQGVFPTAVTADDNDGIVPTGSQRWGTVIHAATADHLDVIGHFHDPRHVPPHHDWLVSGAHFDRRHFEALWDSVVEFMVSGAGLEPTARGLRERDR